MANKKILILIFFCLIYFVSCRFFVCPETSDPPDALDDSIPSLPGVSYYGDTLKQVLLSGRIIVNTKQKYLKSISDYYKDSDICSDNYVILNEGRFRHYN